MRPMRMLLPNSGKRDGSLQVDAMEIVRNGGFPNKFKSGADRVF